MEYSVMKEKLALVTGEDSSNFLLIPPGKNSGVVIMVPEWCNTEWKILTFGIHELLYPKYPADEIEFDIDFGGDFVDALVHQFKRKVQLDLETIRLMEIAGVPPDSYPKFLQCHYDQNNSTIQDIVTLSALNVCLSFRIGFSEKCLAGNSPDIEDYASQLSEALQSIKERRNMSS